MSQTPLLPKQGAPANAEALAWVFLPGVLGQNAALRGICAGSDRHVLDLPPLASSRAAAQGIADGLMISQKGPFLVIGSSYGALVAVELAKALPNLCAGVVLVNPPRALARGGHRFGLLSALWTTVSSLGWLLPRGSRISRSDPLSANLRNNPRLRSEYRKAVLAVLRSLHLIAFRAGECLLSSVEGRLHGCGKPVLILRSDLSPFMGDRSSDVCEEVLISSGDHFPLTTEYATCMASMANWVRRIGISRQVYDTGSTGSGDRWVRPSLTRGETAQ